MIELYVRYNKYVRENREAKKHFKKRLKELTDDIELVGTYYNTNTVCKMRCKICNNEWYERPTTTLKKPWCKHCIGEYEKQFKK